MCLETHGFKDRPGDEEEEEKKEAEPYVAALPRIHVECQQRSHSRPLRHLRFSGTCRTPC